MMKILAAGFALAVTASSVQAAAIRVAPVLIDLTEPARTAVVTLRNEGAAAVTVQARILRWRQVGGADQFDSTTGVVASPPIATIPAGGENVIRIVRTAKEPVVGEESYRLMIDQLPDPKDRKPGTVNLLIRHSIPVFFSAIATTAPQLQWSVDRNGAQLTVVANNLGGSRVRISNFGLKARSGRQLVKADGLVGYVLAGSSARWRFPSPSGSYSGAVDIIAHSEAGLINAQATISR